jgi:hypothetical protein
LSAALLAHSNDPLRIGIERCFSNHTFIPILENGRRVSNSFGMIGAAGSLSTWVANSVLNITVRYEDLDTREFNHIIPILISDDTGFAGTFWNPV